MYHRLVVALDGSELAKRALPYAEALAERFASVLYLVRGLRPPGTLVPAASMPGAPVDPVAAVGDDPQEAVGYLQGVARRLADRGLKAECAVPEGPPAEALVAFAFDVEADLIAMTTHGRGGLRRLVLGSVADGVVRRAPCPVLLVRVGND
jgi:nucleotide-binding universal stress UspA family protein